MNDEHCEAKVHNGYGVSFHQCPRSGKYTYKGRRYCKQHHPPSIEARERDARKCQYLYRYSTDGRPGKPHGAVLKTHETGTYCWDCLVDIEKRRNRAKIAAYDRIAEHVEQVGAHTRGILACADIKRLLKLKGLGK